MFTCTTKELVQLPNATRVATRREFYVIDRKAISKAIVFMPCDSSTTAQNCNHDFAFQTEIIIQFI